MLKGTPRKTSARALVELAREPPALGHVELEERVARCERHPRDVRDVPRADDDSARVGVLAKQADDLGDLIDVSAVRCRPAAPLDAVDGAELAVRVRPLVPDRHAVLLEPAHVRVAAQEPEELDGDRLEVHLLGRHEREPLGQVEAHLVAEDAHACPCPCDRPWARRSRERDGRSPRTAPSLRR